MSPGHPERYGVSAGGIYSAIIYQSLANTYALYGDNNRPDSYLSYSLQRYIEDCMFFANQAGNLSIDDVKQKSVDFNVQLEASVHNSIFTIVQKDADGWRDESNSLTCYETWYGGNAAAGTWDGLRTYLIDSAKFNGMLEQVCSSIGYDVNDAQEKLACQNIMGSLTDYTHGGSLSMSWFEFIRQIFIAHKINEALTTYAPGTTTAWLSNLETMSSTTGIAIVANQWMPVIKGVVTGVAFFLTPFIIMFFTTHIFPRALLTVMMFFIWITLWTIMDVGMHGFAMDYAYNVYQMIRANNSLAYDQIMMMPDAALKGMAVSGIVRSSSMMLATVFTGMLFKGYASTALAALSGNLAGHMRSTGSSSGSTTMMPERAAGRMSAVEVSVPTVANAAKYNFSQRTTAGTFSKARSIESGLQTSEHFNGSFKAAMKTGHAAATKASGDVAYAGSVGGPSGLAGKREMDGLGDKAYTDKGFEDRHELARIGAQSKYQSQKEHPAEVLARAYSGLFPDKDSAHKAYARMKASRDIGWFGQAHTMAMAEMGRKLGFTAKEGPNKIAALSNKSQAFINNLESGDTHAISGDTEQRKAFEDLTGQKPEQANPDSLKKWGDSLSSESVGGTIKASDAMGAMFPARYAAEKHKMDFLMKHHGFSDLQSVLAFGNSVDAMNNLSTAETKLGAAQDIADKHFEGDLKKATAAIADYGNLESMGAVGEHLRLGNDPGQIKSITGQVKANIETGTAEAFEVIGPEGVQEASRFKDLNVNAQSMTARSAAAAHLNKAPSEVTDQDIRNLQKGHHGNNYQTTNEDGSVSHTFSPQGDLLFSHSKQLLNAEGVGNLASQIEGNDPGAARKLRGYLNNSNQDLSYDAMITTDAQGNIATYEIRQPRTSTSDVVMQSSDRSSVTMEDRPLNADASTIWNKVSSMDDGLSNSLLLGTSAEKDTMARTVANSMATQLFLSRHGIDAEEYAGNITFGSGNSGAGSSGLLGKILQVIPSGSLSLRASNGYREQLDKISKDYYDEIRGHQQMVDEGIWSQSDAADSLLKNLSLMTREYKQKEDTSNDIKRGKDIVPGLRE
jgi:hypothetical protein